MSADCGYCDPAWESCENERVAVLTAHRACHSAEHDPLQGKLHGFCVVCGVPWPCEYAGLPSAPAPAEAESELAKLRLAVCNYMQSEGCSCCRDDDAHDKYQREIAAILNIPLYDDGSGVDYYSVVKASKGAERK